MLSTKIGCFAMLASLKHELISLIIKSLNYIMLNVYDYLPWNGLKSL